MPTINYSAALPPDIYTQVGVGSINIGNYINSLKVNLNQLITLLFANSEQGFTQTLDDYSILFQDAAGTTPVTGAGQTLGLVLDKSKGLVTGAEKVVNGDFSNGTAGWDTTIATLSANSGICTVTSTALGATRIGRAIATEIGKTYKVSASVGLLSGVTVDITARVGTTLGSMSTTNASVSKTSSGTYSFFFQATSTSTVIYANMYPTVVGQQFAVSNISVKEIQGNHASQSTSSYRPLLKNTPRRVQYDGIDDKLTTTLPAQLTGCTVIRAIPNVGCQILTNQTIPTTYNDSTSHCGLIVINRALTAYETSQLTQIFNKLAGV